MKNSVHFALNGDADNHHRAASSLLTRTSNQSNEKSGLRVRMDTGNLHWLLHRMYVLGDHKTCQRIIEHQLTATYDHEYLFYVKGLILRDEAKHQEALRFFQKTIELGSKNPLYYKELGRTLFQMGKYNQSLEMFLKAESYLESPDHEIYHYIGKLMSLNAKQQSKRTTAYDAKEYFRRAIMSGHQIQSYRELSSIYRREKDYHRAIELYESCLGYFPDNVDIITQLGIIFLKLNDTELAYEKLHALHETENASTESLLALGAILQIKCDAEGALNIYKNIPNIQSEGFEVWNNIGMCFYRKNKLIAAIACLRKALWLSPLCHNGLYNLGIVLMTAQQFASAFQCFVSAVSMKPDSAESFMMLAICLYYLNDIENAKIAFQKAILSSAAIRNPLIYLNYSIFALECIRDVDDARQALSNFYNLCETMKVPVEFKQIAQAVHVRLPRTTAELAELPAPTNGTTTTVVEIKETKIAEINEDEEEKLKEEKSNENPDEQQQDVEEKVNKVEGDLV